MKLTEYPWESENDAFWDTNEMMHFGIQMMHFGILFTSFYITVYLKVQKSLQFSEGVGLLCEHSLHHTGTYIQRCTADLSFDNLWQTKIRHIRSVPAPSSSFPR